MSSAQIETVIIVLLLFAFAGVSIANLILLERIHQLQGYIKRIEKR